MDSSPHAQEARKRLRLGEFEEVLIPVAFELPETVTDAAPGELLDDFIELIEANDLRFGGSGRERWSGFAGATSKWSRPTAEQARVLRSWPSGREFVQRFWVGPPMNTSKIERRQRHDSDFPTARSGISHSR